MKKLYSLILALLLLLSLSTTAFAASSKTYSLDELGMSIDIPSEYVVFTRNISDNDPNLSAYGLTKNDMKDLMNARNIYLNAWDKDVNFEIIVTMIDSTISDFNLMSDTMLNTMASSAKTEYANNGITVEKYEVFQHNQAKFIKIYISQPNGTEKAYGLQYYTVYDNKAINVTMQSYSGKIDSSKESILKSIVDTVHFDKEPLLPESGPDTQSFVYKDKDSGMEFTVPANWTQKELSKEREYLDVMFASNKEPGLSILYGSTDMWTQMSSSEKKGLSRSDINNSVFTAAELAETMGIEKSSVSTVTYGGEEYYKYTVVNSSSSYGIDLDVEMTCLMRFENGYAYTFQFSGNSKNAYYKDFESLLSSAKYPASSAGAISDPASGFGAVNILLSLLITILVYSVPIIVYRYGITKQPVDKSRAKKITIIYGIIAFIVMSVLITLLNGSGAAGGAILVWSWINYKVLTGGKNKKSEEQTSEMQQSEPVANNPLPPSNIDNRVFLVPTVSEPKEEIRIPSSEEVDVVFCYKCGTKLSVSNEFCHKCGTKIIK